MLDEAYAINALAKFLRRQRGDDVRAEHVATEGDVRLEKVEAKSCGRNWRVNLS